MYLHVLCVREALLLDTVFATPQNTSASNIALVSLFRENFHILSNMWNYLLFLAAASQEYRIAEIKESYWSKFKHLTLSWHVQTCKLVVSREILNAIDHYHCLTYANPSEIKMYERSMVNISFLRYNESLICSYDKCTQVIISTSQPTHNVADCLLENFV